METALRPRISRLFCSDKHQPDVVDMNITMACRLQHWRLSDVNPGALIASRLLVDDGWDLPRPNRIQGALSSGSGLVIFMSRSNNESQISHKRLISKVSSS